MSQKEIIFRIPKELIPLWNKYKQRLAREHSDMKDEDGKISNATAFRAMLLDYARHDFYLLSSNIEKIFPILNRIEGKIGETNSYLLRSKFK